MDLSAFDLKGRVALITGGAHGIGFSIAEGMAKCGATICFNCSSEASLEKGLAAYKAAGIDAHGYAADVSDEDAVNAMVAKIKAEVGPVDILVNNAGLMKRVPMVEMSHADFMRVIDVHVGGAFNCSKAVLPDMMEKQEGKIINTICSTHWVTEALGSPASVTSAFSTVVTIGTQPYIRTKSNNCMARRKRACPFALSLVSCETEEASMSRSRILQLRIRV